MRILERMSSWVSRAWDSSGSVGDALSIASKSAARMLTASRPKQRFQTIHRQAPLASAFTRKRQPTASFLVNPSERHIHRQPAPRPRLPCGCRSQGFGRTGTDRRWDGIIFDAQVTSESRPVFTS